MSDTTHGIAGRSLAEWRDFARKDYCLDCMVPSDLRHVLGALTDLQAERDAWKVRAEAAEAALIYEVKRSRRHLAKSTLDLVAKLGVADE